MKNVIILFCSVLMLICSNHLKAQTKEETITWLSDKIAANGCESISDDGKSILIPIRSYEDVTYDWGTAKAFVNYIYRVPFDAISRIETYEWDGYIHGGHFTLYTIGNRIKITNEDGVLKEYTNTVDFKHDCYDTEDNLRFRLIKAFKKLIEYNKANTNETF